MLKRSLEGEVQVRLTFQSSLKDAEHEDGVVTWPDWLRMG
jgi:hypothetical protein